MAEKYLHTSLVALVVLLGTWWHAEVGLSLPYPCGDEVVFYYPSQALAQHGVLASEHLYPGRTLHWMPPAYMAVLAGWIKVVGTGLVKARWLSYFLAAFAFVGFWAFWNRMALPKVGLVLVAVAFLSRYWVVMGNMVRMEGLLLCLLWLALWAIWEGKTLASAGLLVLALTIHPTTLYFMLMWPVWVALAPRHSWRGGVNIGTALLGLVVTGSYGLYVLQHFDAFVNDWQWQLSTRNMWGGLEVLLFRPDQAVFATALSAFIFWAIKSKNKQLGFVLATAFMCWVLRILGQGWSYGIFNVIAVTLVLGCGLFWVQQRLAAWVYAPSVWVQRVLLGLLVVGAVPVLAVGKIYNIPLTNRAAYAWNGMQMQPKDTPFMTADDARNIYQLLLKKLPAKQNKVYFVGEAEGIEIAPSDTGRILHVMPIFEQNYPDYIVIHHSTPSSFFDDEMRQIVKNLPLGTALPPPIYQRQDQRWYLIPVLKEHYPPFIITVKEHGKGKKL